jgi:predicted P-loop ATPase
VCCEELDTMRPSELNQLKAAVTMPSIDERAAYAHFHEHRQHIASFCGTGNNIQFLSDPTGNRRWLPFEIESIESPREHPFDYEGIYAQAYALYQQGFQYWFSREEIMKLSEHNKQFETPRLEKELIQLYFRKPIGVEGGIFMSTARAMQIVSSNISQKLNPVQLGRAFGELGFKRIKYQGVRGYVVMLRTGDEIQRIQRLMVDNGEMDSGQ